MKNTDGVLGKPNAKSGKTIEKAEQHLAKYYSFRRNATLNTCEYKRQEGHWKEFGLEAMRSIKRDLLRHGIRLQKRRLCEMVQKLYNGNNQNTMVFMEIAPDNGEPAGHDVNGFIE